MMRADDPRHGTYAGASAHWKAGEPLCGSCARAGARVRKRNKYLQETNRPATLPSLGTVRRIRALQALGWTHHQIADAANVPIKTIRGPMFRGSTVYRATAEAVAKAYDELSMRLPQERTTVEKRNASYARTHARKNGWLPPLAWDDIDDPDEEPNVGPAVWDETSVDEAVVLRVINERKRPRKLTSAECSEIVHRLIARGLSGHEIQRDYGFKVERYYRQGDAA